MGRTEPGPGVRDSVEAAMREARAFIDDFAPDLVVLFGPDHFNGFFHDVMPAFCIAAAAASVGDYGLPAGPLRVDADAARGIAAEVLRQGVDVAHSERMQVDHAFSQPLQLLFGGLDAVPVVPVFVNCTAEPLGPVARARLLGAAVGRAVVALGRRVLVVGSGGLSHDPPVPQLRGAGPAVAERLIAGRNPSPQERSDREARVVAAARESDRMPLNPQWDADLMALLASGDLDRIDGRPNEWFVTNAGRAAHEVRTWIAAYAALGAGGDYRVATSFYAPIPEWIAGFGLTTARSLATAEATP
ncbi:3-carboxyethylcatechol 2,3-dioxygenase [Pseudonocardia sp. WMMC193]|nr:3-carboxyethylcatechol 2,3-dioxygenase [Pseudonocardia sp. WMMC193]